MNSYNVKRFNFMKTHPPIEHIQSVTLSLYIYYGGFMGWVVVGWFECSWVGGGVGGWRVHGVGDGGVCGWRGHGVVVCIVVRVVVGGWLEGS